MKNVLLALLFIVAIGMNSNAANTPSNSKSVIFNTTLSTICKLVQMGDVDGVKNLIESGTNINQKSCGMTPLMFAARQNKTDMVKLLLSRGAKLKIKSDKGLTALDYAKKSNATESYNLIIQALNS